LEEVEKELNAVKNEVNLAKESKDRKAITAALEKEKKAAANVAKAEENLNKAKVKVKKT
jgi:hypothetical protein